MIRRLIVLFALLTLAACAQPRQSLFVVLPKADGSVGAITVDDGKKSVLLDEAYAAAEVRDGTAAPAHVTAAQVQQVFGSALAARPILPRHFSLYFVIGTDKLTARSEADYKEVFADILRRPVYEVEVVGHTDTQGGLAYNQKLSLARAKAVRDRLVGDGLKASGISVAGRGQLDPAVPTKDGVDEPRNRRVEITVR